MHDVIPSKDDHTIRIEWKIPARLRKASAKPPKKPLAKRHKKQPGKKTAIHFDRKKIETKAEKNIALPKHRFFTAPSLSTTVDISINAPIQSKAKKVPQSSQIENLVRPPKKFVNPLLMQERDIAYSFPVQSKPTLLAPEHAQIMMPKASVQLPTRSTAVSAFFLLVGFAVASFLVWSLQGAGRGTAALSTIQDKAENAFSHILEAQNALADTNTIESERQFSAASQELTSAKADMDEALAASKNVLRALDISGTVKSGQNMLDLGVALSDAGVHMSRAITPFLSVSLNTSLTDAIIAAKPHLENAEESINVAQEKIEHVQITGMPENVIYNIEKLRIVIPKAKNTLHHLVEESGTLLTLLGAEHDKQYLVLFANSDELRPVGGFIGTVGLVNVSRGKVENIDVKSVYDGDGQLKKFLAPPNPLLSIVNRWFLRDSNWFVDFSVSARKAAELFEKEGGPTVDGIILMTPKVIQNLLSATGPIHVPGYDVTVTAENFIEVTQAEVTYDYDRTLNKPKEFLSDLTPLLLTRLFSASSPQDGNGKMKTLQALTKSLGEKDLLLNFADEHAQTQARELGWAGTLPASADGFLMVNNANIGGHKSDQFIEQEIDYRASITANGDVDVVLTVRRTHHGPDEKIDFDYREEGDPAEKDNVTYQRTLVPYGAQLIEAKGFTAESDVPAPVLNEGLFELEADPDVAAWQGGQTKLPNGTVVGSESGYTFFANWVITKPGQTSVTLYQYTIPNAVRMPNALQSASSYALSIAKQPGQHRNSVRASIEIPSTMKISKSVPGQGVTLETDSAMVYRGQLTSDIVPGIVFEKR
ncbi:MAG: DUF4012 domain-containing protein [bacterium]|nr:DUF4012 domain-containing protein [bacterium]